MTLRRIARDRKLTPEEAAKYKLIREQVAKELPEIVARHHERTAILDQFQELMSQLRAERESQGLK